MSDTKHVHFWQTPQFAIWVLTFAVTLLSYAGKAYVSGYVDKLNVVITSLTERVNKIEEVQKVNLPKLFVAEADVKSIKDGQERIVSELRDINKFLRENHNRGFGKND